MRLYDSSQRALVDIEVSDEVAMYVCGITPYDATHLGHAATYTTFDVIARRLIDAGHSVRMVRNITDVDDDLLRAARTRGLHHLDLAFGEVRAFDEDMAALGNLDPWSEPRATGAIPEIRGLIHELLDSGWAYAVDGWVYLDSGHPRFGQLSKLEPEERLEKGSRRGERPDDHRKRRQEDTVLWRTSDRGEPAWEAPWGDGRPGWHVECTALALRELPDGVDIHGGGADLFYPHHEFSDLQHRAGRGTPLARYWVHQAIVTYGGAKIAKSTQNLVFVADLRERYDPMAIRMLLLGHHYRRGWDFTFDAMDVASRRLEAWRSARGARSSIDVDVVRARLDDDLDTPGTLDFVDAQVAAGADPTEAAALLGLDLEPTP